MVFWPLTALSRKRHGQVYGPPASQLAALRERPASVPIWWPVAVPKAAGLDGDARRAVTLRETLRVVTQDLIAQIKPRHSEYYESEVVLDRVADLIAGTDTPLA